MLCSAFCCVLEYLGRSGLKAALLENRNAGPPVQAFATKPGFLSTVYMAHSHTGRVRNTGYILPTLCAFHTAGLGLHWIQRMHVCCFENVSYTCR